MQLKAKCERNSTVNNQVNHVFGRETSARTAVLERNMQNSCARAKLSKNNKPWLIARADWTKAHDSAPHQGQLASYHRFRSLTESLPDNRVAAPPCLHKMGRRKRCNRAVVIEKCFLSLQRNGNNLIFR